MIIYGSSRSKGNTYQTAKYLANITGLELVDLNELTIGFYDYEHKNSGDDFLKLAERMANSKIIVLVSPVYWYTMSAQMKVFLDRWSDLVTIRKDLGRKLNGVKLSVVSCSGDPELGEGFDLPFSQTAKYLDMTFMGHFHTWKVHEVDWPDEVLEILESLSEGIKEVINN